MTALEVAEFVREHRFDLVARQAREQRVEEHDPLGRAEAGEIRIAVCRTAAAVHHEQALGGETAALHQCFDAAFQRFVLERLELVEERCDKRRIQYQHEQLKRDPDDPSPQPPQAARLVHQPQHDKQQRQPERGAEQDALETVEEENTLAHPVEAKALLDHELPVVLERQIDRAGDRDHRRDQRDLTGVAAAKPVGDRQIERLHAAQQRQTDQHGRADDDLDHCQSRAFDGVVGGALVRGERDGAGKLARHLLTMAGDEADLPRREPQFGADHRHDGDDEQNSEVQGRHPGIPWYLCENYMFLPARRRE